MAKKQPAADGRISGSLRAATRREFSPLANTDSKLIEQHRQWLRDERDKFYESNRRRRTAEDSYNGKNYLDDAGAQEPWLRDVRLNGFRPEADLLIHQVANNTLYPHITHTGPGFNEQTESLAKLREMQNRALVQESGYSLERLSALKDAAVGGDGWIRYGLSRSPEHAGKLVVRAKHINWENIIYDSDNCPETGNIDKGRYLAEFTLAEADRLAIEFPAAKAVIHKLERGRPWGRLRAIEEDWDDFEMSEWFDRTYFGGETQARRLVTYGIMYYYNEQSELLHYAFVCDRNISSMYALTDPVAAYGHNCYPYVRIVCALDVDGLPFSPVAQDKIGLERINQYLLRQTILRSGGRMVLIGQEAIPTAGDGEGRMPVAQAVSGWQEQLQSPVPFLFVNNLGAIKIESMDSQTQEMVNTIGALSAFESRSGAAINPHLTGGGGKTPMAGVAMRQHADNSMASMRQMLATDREAVRKIGKLNLYLLQDYAEAGRMDVPQGYAGDGGDMTRIPDNLLTSTLPMVAAGHFGISVETIRRTDDWTQEQIMVLNEIIKTLAGHPALSINTVLATADALPFKEGTLAQIADAAQKSGIDVPEKYLSPQMREDKKQMKVAQEQNAQQAQAMQMTAFQLEMRKMMAEISDKIAAAGLKTAQTDKAQAEAAAEAAALAPLPPETQEAAVRLGGEDLVNQLADKDAQIAALQAQLKGGGA